VQAMQDALATFGRGARKAIDDATALNDADTADLFTEISRGVDKSLWMVEAHVQDRALDSTQLEEPSASREASRS
jgi:starvation-inducible DNA-binding protein